MSKITIRFFDDREVRAVWDDDNSKWWFSMLDIVGVLRSNPSDTQVPKERRNVGRAYKFDERRHASRGQSFATPIEHLSYGI